VLDEKQKNAINAIRQILVQFGKEEIGNRLTNFSLTALIQLIDAQLAVIMPQTEGDEEKQDNTVSN